MSVASDKSVFAIETRRLAVSHDAVVKSSDDAALVVGATGAVNPAFQVDASATGSITGVLIASDGLTKGAHISVISPEVDAGLTIDAKGDNAILMGSVSTGGVVIEGGLEIVDTGIDVTAGGVRVQAGGIDVTAGGIDVTAGGLTVTAGVAALNGGLSVPTGALTNVSTSPSVGGIYSVDPTGGNVTVTLPTLTTVVGHRFQFILATNTTNTVTITLGTGNTFLNGVIVDATPSQVSGATSITFGATANVGDMIELMVVASGFVAVRAFSSVDSGITAA
jgi:hypothetical protein